MSNIRHTQHVTSTYTSSITCGGPVISLMHSLDRSLPDRGSMHTGDESSTHHNQLPRTRNHHDHHACHITISMYILCRSFTIYTKEKKCVILGIKLTRILPPVGWHFERRLISWSPGPATHRLASACHLNFWSRSRGSVVRSQRFPKLCLKAWTCKSLQAHWRWRGKNESWLHLACKRREASKGERDTKRRGRLFSEAAFQIKRHTMNVQILIFKNPNRSLDRRPHIDRALLPQLPWRANSIQKRSNTSNNSMWIVTADRRMADEKLQCNCM